MKKNNKSIIVLIVMVVIILCIASFFLGAYLMNKTGSKQEGKEKAVTPTVTAAGDNDTSGKLITLVPTVTLEPTVTVTPTVAPTVTSDNKNFVYHNTQFGFDFKLPGSWDGYTVLSDVWQGIAVEGVEQGNIVESGIELRIRHPQWTKENPRQDIPIMVFTLDQWSKIEKEKLAVSAAPIGPSKLGSNSKYVFALPPRYNYAYETGYEEVDKIVNSKALVPNENFAEILH